MSRDYCEACGYTDSHDPNCPRPKEAHMSPDKPVLIEAFKAIQADYARAVELGDSSLLGPIMSRWCDLFFQHQKEIEFCLLHSQAKSWKFWTDDLALSALDRQYWVGVNFGDGTTRWIRPTPAQINEPPQAGQGDTTAPSHEGHAAGPASGSPDEGKK